MLPPLRAASAALALLPIIPDSLERIKALPPETTLYCAHEYTQANAKFALHADPDNAALQDYVGEIDERRATGEWTVPFPLSRELVTNPFLLQLVGQFLPGLVSQLFVPIQKQRPYGVELCQFKPLFKGN